MKAICTYCAGPKRSSGRMIPAVSRYLSRRTAQLHQLAQQRDVAFFILSGQYGLLLPDHPLPWYDHLLHADDVEKLVPAAATVLANAGITEVEYHTADPAVVPQVAPYGDVLRQACLLSDIRLEIVVLAGNPE